MMRGEERLVVLARPGEAGAAHEIVLTQEDVRQVQLCKGAIASGVAMLQHVAGVPDDEVAELMLAGGFGNYLGIAERAAHRPHSRDAARRARSATWATPPRSAPSSRSCRRPSARAPTPSPRASSTSRWPPIPTSRTSSWTCMNFPRGAMKISAAHRGYQRRARSITRSTRAGSWRTRPRSGETEPEYLDTTRPARPRRAPALPGVLRVAAGARPARARRSGDDIAARGVHATHDLTPPPAAARGRSPQHDAPRSPSVESRGPAPMCSRGFETVDARGEPVSTTRLRLPLPRRDV